MTTYDIYINISIQKGLFSSPTIFPDDVNCSWFIEQLLYFQSRWPLFGQGYQGTDHDTVNYRSVWRQLHYYITDKNNNDSFDCHDIHNHRSSYCTHCDTSDNVCLILHSCWYSIYIKWHDVQVLQFFQMMSIVHDL
jgi:hypothetical protein